MRAAASASAHRQHSLAVTRERQPTRHAPVYQPLASSVHRRRLALFCEYPFRRGAPLPCAEVHWELFMTGTSRLPLLGPRVASRPMAHTGPVRFWPLHKHACALSCKRSLVLSRHPHTIDCKSFAWIPFTEICDLPAPGGQPQMGPARLKSPPWLEEGHPTP
jgi:hypothetical protein